MSTSGPAVSGPAAVSPAGGERDPEALLGLAAAERQWTRHFQANTERRRPVLSTVFLGQELWRNHRLNVTLAELFDSLKRLKLLVIHEAQYA